MTELIIGRALVRAFNVTLPVIERAAKKISRERHLIDAYRKKFPTSRLSDTAVLARIRAENLRRAKLYAKRRAEQEKRYWHGYTSRVSHRDHTQEELREIAKKVHWSRIIYRAGTNYIVEIEGGWRR